MCHKLFGCWNVAVSNDIPQKAVLAVWYQCHQRTLHVSASMHVAVECVLHFFFTFFKTFV